MARIDDLISQVTDGPLRGQLTDAAAELRKRKKFGLVFEEHVPESVLVGSSTQIRVGAEVMLRKEPEDRTRYVVTKLTKHQATISDGEATRTVKKENLLVMVPFGEPVYPVLQPTTTPVVRSDTKPFHTVIKGENFHALQLLSFGFAGKVDCMYLDPPYNSGAKDWTYSNDYVDGSDAWRHSKWLSMMEKRLRLAQRLLTPNGVMIITIDENEVQNLGVLLRQMFPSARVQMVTIVTNTAGSMSPGLFSRADEYAYFCFFGDAVVLPMTTDLLADSKPTTQFWFPVHRSRGLNDKPSKRSNLVYPIGVDPETLKIVGTGPSLKDREDAGEDLGDLDAWVPDPDETLDGYPVVWPILDTGELSTWQLASTKLMSLFAEGFVRVREPRGEPGPRPFTLAYVKSGNQAKVRSGEVPVTGHEPCGTYILAGGDRTTIPKTVWKQANHDARLYGTTMLRALAGATGFTYPKSPYAVRDALATVVADKPNALILDFFAGSGTTLQAVAMLNLDGGNRRTILVTNNEVSEADAESLRSRGYAPGDPQWEEQGICTKVTVPRCSAVITGNRADGQPVEGDYDDGSPLADGMAENAAFFDLVYDDPDRIEVGQKFEEILPALWLAAGGVGDPSRLKAQSDWFLSDDVPFAVLLDEDRFTEFAKLVRARTDVTNVWLVTDSTSAFARMRDRLPKTLEVGMLYRDYLRTFRINVGASA